jgi:hypothetical protein
LRETEESIPFRALEYLPADSLCFVVWKAIDLRDSIRSVLDELDEYSIARGDTPLSEKIKQTIEVDLRAELLPIIGKEIVVSVRAIKPFIAYPLPEAEVILQTTDGAGAERLVRRLVSNLQINGFDQALKSEEIAEIRISFLESPLGRIGYALHKGHLIAALGKDIIRENLEAYAQKAPTIKQNEYFAALNKEMGDKANLILFINLNATSDALELVSQQTVDFKPEHRLRLERYRKLANVLRHAKAGMLTAESKPDGIYAHLAIPVE